MKFGPIDFPQGIINAVKSNLLVIFAGAGVSMGEPSCLPSFAALAERISPDIEREKNEPIDRYLGRLQREGVPVHRKAAEMLLGKGEKPNLLHTELLRIFQKPEDVRIVTTNFDKLFEVAARNLWDNSPEVYSAPAIPLGKDFTGIVHIHGIIDKSRGMVLTDSDFGRAYLTEGWASKFLVDLFHHYTVLFVGYSHDDDVMRYLSRGLPVERVMDRYALIGSVSDKTEKWEMLDICPIRFRQPRSGEKYEALNVGVRHFAQLLSRGMLDWGNRIEVISRATPPFSASLESEIRWILQSEGTAKCLTRQITKSSWLRWLDKRGFLDVLFQEEELEPHHKVLANWVANTFAVRTPDILTALIVRHHIILNPTFWVELLNTLIEAEDLDKVVLSRYVLILTSKIPSVYQRFLVSLANACAKANHIPALALVFHRACAYDVCHAHLSSASQQQNGKRCVVSVEVCFRQNYYTLAKMWGMLKGNISEVHGSIIRSIVNILENISEVISLWGNGHHKIEPFSFKRLAIEEHPQNQKRNPEDALIDALRDSLEWLRDNHPEQLDKWISISTTSSSQALKRIAIHIMGTCKDKSANERTTWLIDNVDIFNVALHHEIFRFLENCYAETDFDVRARILETILDQRSSITSDRSEEEATDRLHLKWLSWLLHSAPECPIVQEAIVPLRAKHPEWRESEHPDFLIWFSSGGVSDMISPYLAEQLLSLSPGDHWEAWGSFGDESFHQPSREGLLAQIEQACNQSAQWAIQLMIALERAEQWESDLWVCVLRGWSEKKRVMEEWERFLPHLSHIELFPFHAMLIATLLHSLVDKADKSLQFDILSKAKNIAISLWESLLPTEPTVVGEDSFLCAVNHPAGELVWFWLKALDCERQWEKDIQNVLPIEYRKQFELFLNSASENSGRARCILASRASFLLDLDVNWTRSNMLPLFRGIKKVFLQAWNGFLSMNEFSAQFIQELHPALPNACRRMNWFVGAVRERFVEYMAFVSVYHEQDPLNGTLSAFYHSASDVDRTRFINHIEIILHNMESGAKKRLWDDWLREYLLRRAAAGFGPLRGNEISEIVNWAPYMEDIYPDFIELIAQFPGEPFENQACLYRVCDNGLVGKYQEATAKLLIFFLKSAGYRNSHKVSGIAQELRGIKPETKDLLNEELMRAGIEGI